LRTSTREYEKPQRKLKKRRREVSAAVYDEERLEKRTRGK
jgi:hypothetical protein